MATLLDIIEPIEDISLWAMDETGKRLESNNFYSWSPKGKPIEIERNGCHKGLNILGATEVLKHFGFVYEAHSKEDGTVTADHIVKYIKNLMKYDKARGISITMILMDNAKIHTAQEVKDFVKENSENLVLLFQPPYSPELNPQENMWKWMKGFIAKASASKNINELRDEVDRFGKFIAKSHLEVKHWLYARNFFK